MTHIQIKPFYTFQRNQQSVSVPSNLQSKAVCCKFGPALWKIGSNFNPSPNPNSISNSNPNQHFGKLGVTLE